MAIVVEDGTGKTDADAYISVADADTYHVNYTGSASWAAATTATKEIAIRNATQYIDIKYNGRWRGRRTHDTQALDWPRSSIADRDGYGIDSDEMPTRLLNACAEMAVRHVDGDTLIVDVSAGDNGIKSEAVSVGPVSSDIEYSGVKSTAKKYAIVANLLSEFLFSKMGSVERG